MNKEIWNGYSDELPCPRCQKGKLKEYKTDISSETLDSQIENDFGSNGVVCPDASFLAAGHLKCSQCNDIVVMCYERVDDVRHTDEEGNEICEIIPLFYSPAPPLISIPNSCPPTVAGVIKQSFSLYWVDLASCANKIRIALEVLMDHFKIDQNLSLHQRIKAFEATHFKISSYLLAAKWIGNSGSHRAEVTRNAVLDAYELLEYILEQLFNDKERSLDELSARINAAKKYE